MALKRKSVQASLLNKNRGPAIAETKCSFRPAENLYKDQKEMQILILMPNFKV